MKTCAEYKTVSREDGSTYERCARYEESDTALVPSNGDDFGRRSRKRSKKFGIVVPQPLRGMIPGLGIKIKTPSLIAGGGGAVAGMWLAKNGYLAQILPGAFGAMSLQNWPMFGAAVGAAASVPLYLVKKDKQAMIGGIVVAAITGVAGLLLQKTGVLAGLGMRRRRGYGLLTSQQVGSLPTPQVHDTTRVPRNVQVQTDISAWGAAM